MYFPQYMLQVDEGNVGKASDAFFYVGNSSIYAICSNANGDRK